MTVEIVMRDGDRWTTQCTAALWKPRVLLTAAHCLTKSGGGTVVDEVKVFPPGAAVPASVDVQSSASPIPVAAIVRPDGYTNLGTLVERDDIAAIVLASDLAASPITRLATFSEVLRLVVSGSPVMTTGYGQTGPGLTSELPNTVSLPLVSLAHSDDLGEYFLAGTGAGRGSCPGDSGSPVISNGASGTVLLGILAGSSGPCYGQPEGTTINFRAMGYLKVLNDALAQAGLPLVPGSPEGIEATVRNRNLLVSWGAPVIAPEAVVDYEIIGSDGHIACSTQDTRCEIRGLSDGTYQFFVRSRNAQGEGNDFPIIKPIRVAGPSRMARPWLKQGRLAFRTLVGTSSAVIEQYQVRDSRGQQVCAITDIRTQQRVQTCELPTGQGTDRYQVRAVTQMGTTAWSPSSKPIHS